MIEQPFFMNKGKFLTSSYKNEVPNGMVNPGGQNILLNLK